MPPPSSSAPATLNKEPSSGDDDEGIFESGQLDLGTLQEIIDTSSKRHHDEEEDRETEDKDAKLKAKLKETPVYSKEEEKVRRYDAEVRESALERLAMAQSLAPTNPNPRKELDTSTPGAYQGAPGEALHRNDPARFSRLQIEADCQDAATHNEDCNALPSKEEALFAIAYDNSPVEMPDGSISVASARLVEEEEVFQAKPAPDDKKRIRWAVVLITCLLLAVVVPVSVWASRKKYKVVVRVSLECGTALTNQADYRGTINTTETGVACQAWDSQYPNSHRFTPEEYPNAGLQHNYCRNPDGDVRPWCFPNKTGYYRLYCSVPFCDDGNAKVNNLLCGTLRNNQRQSDYRGTINTTWSGLACQPWADKWPHEHEMTVENYPNAGLESNYCRNPDGDNLAWCYTTSNETRWEHCDVPFCEVMFSNETDHLEISPKAEATVANTTGECGSSYLLQSDYRGQINVTETGRTCQDWSVQEPHFHDWNTPEHNPEAGLEGNFCRNPDGEPRAWCYTTDPDKRWEFCNVPYCPSKVDLTRCGTYDWKQKDYVGSLNVTKSGHACQSWSEQSPHYHLYLPALVPDANLGDHNYCRNPLGDDRAWCYTTLEDVIWEYCDVPFCQTKEEREKSFLCGSKGSKQSDYRGSIAVTESGRRCQRWDSQFPHEHVFRQEEMPLLEENYCRNPDGEARAWCYTDDVRKKREVCNVPFCEEMEVASPEGAAASSSNSTG